LMMKKIALSCYLLQLVVSEQFWCSSFFSDTCIVWGRLYFL
jgi:hypothetical protein